MKILKIVVEVVEGQKLTLTGEQLEAQPEIKVAIMNSLAGPDNKVLIQSKEKEG
jgi:hypothetical protein